MKHVLTLSIAVIILCACTACIEKNPISSIFYEKAYNSYNQNDYSSAFINYQKAAGLGDTEAQYHLSHMYLDGKGTTKNESEGIIWLQKSADNGFVPAQVSLGLRHQFGAGVSQDPAKAYTLFLLAAQAENPDAQFLLASLLATGQGTAKNIKEALKWFRIAKSNGFPIPPHLLTLNGVSSIGKNQSIEKQQVEKQPSKKEQIAEIQGGLTKLGYKPGPIDGLLGKKTSNAIMLFQKKHGLVIDGKPSNLLLINIIKALE